MAIRQLKQNMGIISALSDEPNDIDGLTSTELKAKFDAAGNIIKEYVNTSLIPDVEDEIVKTVSDTVVQSGNLPVGGLQGQALIKKSNASYDWEFKTLVAIPSGGTKGQVLTKASSTEYDARFEDLKALPLDWQAIQEYKTAGTYTWKATDVYGDGQPYEIGVYIIGGGGSGGAARTPVGGSSWLGGASGGGSGYTRVLTMTVTPNSNYSVVVGAGGTAVASSTASITLSGNAGGTSSFNGNTALGGEGGKASITGGLVAGASGGQGSTAVDAMRNTPLNNLTAYTADAPAMGEVPKSIWSSTYYLALSGRTSPTMCFNPFNKKRYLGAGGGANVYSYSGSGNRYAQTAPTLDDGLSAGAGASSADTPALTGNTATSPGSGGGGVAVAANSSTTITSGRGAPGAVLIYARRPVR